MVPKKRGFSPDPLPKIFSDLQTSELFFYFKSLSRPYKFSAALWIRFGSICSFRDPPEPLGASYPQGTTVLFVFIPYCIFCIQMNGFETAYQQISHFKSTHLYAKQP